MNRIFKNFHLKSTTEDSYVEDPVMDEEIPQT